MMDDNAKIPLPSDPKLPVTTGELTTSPAAATPEPESWTAGKRLGAWINTIAMIVLTILILGALNYLGARRFIRYDMTANQEYRLSERGRSILAGIKTPVKIVTVFLNPFTMTYEEGNARERLNGVLDEFKNCSPLVTLEPFSYGMDRAAMTQKYKQLNLQGGLSDKSVIVFTGGRSKTILLSSMFEMDYQSRFPRVRSFNAEGLLLSAILELTGEKPPLIYFSQGHGIAEGKTERGRADDANGIVWIANRLKERENIEHKIVNLILVKQVPEDCKILVIHNPTIKYGEHEVSLLRDYLKRGGRLAVMVGPIDDKGFLETGLEGLLAEWGVRLGRNVVLMTDGRFLFERPIVQFDNFGAHPIVLKFRDAQVPCRLGLSRTLHKAEGVDSRIEVTPLITLPEGAWGETSLEQIGSQNPRPDNEDAKPPVDLAMAVHAAVPPPAKTEKDGAPPAAPRNLSSETRLVIVGCSEFINDRLIREGANEDLFINALLWLIDREQNIGIGAKSIADRRVTMDEKKQAVFLWLGVVALPALGVVLGLGLWFIRRK
jgi:hypothetical protein